MFVLELDLKLLYNYKELCVCYCNYVTDPQLLNVTKTNFPTRYPHSTDN